MLFEANLSAGFWIEAVRTVVYLLNQLPVSCLPDRKPEEAFTGDKPNITHL